MAEHGDRFQVFSLDDCVMTFITWIQDTYHVHWWAKDFGMDHILYVLCTSVDAKSTIWNPLGHPTQIILRKNWIEEATPGIYLHIHAVSNKSLIQLVLWPLTNPCILSEHHWDCYVSVFQGDYVSSLDPKSHGVPRHELWMTLHSVVQSTPMSFHWFCYLESCQSWRMTRGYWSFFHVG